MTAMDPRLAVIPFRLGGVKRIIVVCSGKGGVGKTLISTLFALLASQRGKRVGLLDLDFHGPSVSVVLGCRGCTPLEDKGLIPVEVAGVKVMSLDFFAGSAPLPLRGRDATEALIELLAVTRWGELDLLVVDSPPGTGDELLDAVRLLKGVEALVVTTPSKLALSSVSRLVGLLKAARVPVLGVLENMRVEDDVNVQRMAAEWGLVYLGWLPYDRDLERALGDPSALLSTSVSRSLERILETANLLA